MKYFILFLLINILAINLHAIKISEISKLPKSYDQVSCSKVTLYEHENDRYKKILKIELFNGHITIYDIIKDVQISSHLMSNDSFIKCVIDSLSSIIKNPIGKRMLADLIEKINEDNDNKVIIINSKFLLTENSPIIDEIADDLVINSNIKYWSNLLESMPLGSVFMPKETTENEGMKHHTVMLDFKQEAVISGISNTWQCALNNNFFEKHFIDTFNIVNNIKLTNETTVFHELNHARHFLKKVKTTDEIGEVIDNKNSNNSSLIANLHENLGNQQGIMQNSEEELQLTGFTITKNNDTIYDYINEIAYRLSSNMSIRFPYITLSEATKINGNILLQILKTSLPICFNIQKMLL